MFAHKEVLVFLFITSYTNLHILHLKRHCLLTDSAGHKYVPQYRVTQDKIPHQTICNISAISGLILKILEAA